MTRINHITCYNIVIEQNMKQRTRGQLQAHRNSLSHQLQQLNLDCLHHYHHLQQLGEPQSTEMQEDLMYQRDNIARTKQVLAQITLECGQGQQDKKKIMASIANFESKYSQVSEVMEQQQHKYDIIRRESGLIEQEIKESRDHYERLQEQIHSLDAKVDNIKKYGTEQVPPQIMLLCKERQLLRFQLTALDQEIAIGKKNSSQMVSKQQFKQLQQRMEDLQSQKQIMETLNQQNKILTRQNSQLNQLKSGYEWNPNEQMKQLEDSLAQEEDRISSLEKEIHLIHRRSKECTQKIHHYQAFLEDTSRCLEQSKSGKGKSSMFQELKLQIGIQEVTVPLEMSNKGKEKKKENESIGRTYRLNRKVELVQLCILIITLIGLCYCCHKSYKK